jgi:hypothetical protein
MIHEAENLLMALTHAAPQNSLPFVVVALISPESEIWLLLATDCVVHINQ